MENALIDLKQVTKKGGLMEIVLLWLRMYCERMPNYVLSGLHNDPYNREMVFLSVFKKRFYLFFRDWGREGERGEKHQLVASYMPPPGDLACNPGHVP